MSKDNPALTPFYEQKAKIDFMLDQIKQMSDAHFFINIDHVTMDDAEQLSLYANLLLDMYATISKLKGAKK